MRPDAPLPPPDSTPVLKRNNFVSFYFSSKRIRAYLTARYSQRHST